MKHDQLRRKRLIKEGHKLADRAYGILRHIVSSINKAQKKAA